MEKMERSDSKEIIEKQDLTRAIEKKTAKGQPFARLTSIEFRRVILHIAGELTGFDVSNPKKYGARFVNRDRTKMFYPAHFDIAEDGRSFELTMNIMCSRGEKPIVSGKYALVIFERYEGHGKEKHYTNIPATSRPSLRAAVITAPTIREISSSTAAPVILTPFPNAIWTRRNII